MKLSGICLFFLVVATTGQSASPLFNTFEDFEALNSQKIVGLTQDYDGFLWIATEKNIFRFDGSYFKSLNEIIPVPNDSWNQIIGIEIDANNRIWILTRNNGLFIYDKRTISRPVWHDNLDTSVTKPVRKIIFKDNTVWLINQYSISQVSENNKVQTTLNHEIKSDVYKNAILDKDNNILVATKKQLSLFNTSNHTYQNVNFTDQPNPPFIWDIHSDVSNNLWLSSDIGIYRQLNHSKKWQPFQTEKINTPVKSISSDHEHIWFASAINGLYQYDLNNEKLFKYQKSNQLNTIPTNELSLSFIDRNQNLWLATYDNKLIRTTRNLTDKKINIDCSQSEIYYDFTEFQDNFLLVAQDGIVIQNKNNEDCQFIQTDDFSHYESITLSPRVIAVDSKDQIWIGGRLGLAQLEKQNNQFTLNKNLIINSPKGIQFIAPLKNNKLLIGTSSDLILFDKKSHKFQPIDNNISSENHPHYTYYTTLESTSYIATSHGVLALDLKTNKLISNIKISTQTQGEDIKSIAHDGNTVYFSIKHKGLYSYNLMTDKMNPINLLESLNSVYSLSIDEHKNLWLSSNLGVIKYNLANHNFTLIDKDYGVFDYSFILNSFYEDSNGLIYYGTRNGLIRINPNYIYDEEYHPPIAISQLTRFNQPVKTGKQYEGFSIKSNVNELNDLELTHKDRVMGFHFSVLDLSNASKYSYAYRLYGFDPNWSFTSSKNPNVTYTNLPSGHYQLEIKAKNNNNIWLPEIKTLKIKVYPAPWLSWWAFLLYFFILITAVLFFIHLRIKNSKKLAQQLALDVAEKTNTLNKQKKTIEQLLDKKNQLFSQVSHEFRTPLTLILGPINDIIQANNYHKNRAELEMVARNANRLLSLVEQLLSLAKVTTITAPKLIEQNSQQQVASIVESFQFMAKKNNIHLKLIKNQDVCINTTDQGIDGILGNLISNAIKYSKPNSDVEINSFTNGDYLNITIQDSGPGLTEQNKKHIFQHFNRLPQHQNIEGVGIGLSVVEELIQTNKGTLTVHSELGIGSIFCVQLPINRNPTDSINHFQTESNLIKQISMPQESTNVLKTIVDENRFDEKYRNTILIIEDNNDMREHIRHILARRYGCYLAPNGKQGIKLAIEHIPDMIICDVMMPEMDGFKVSRIIRSDNRTSHIPLILLTALNDQKNRIKGWREQVDSYMTKPFDRDELLIRIESILTIRDILKKKTGERLSQSNLSHTELPKIDKQFIKKLQDIYAEQYQDTSLTKSKIADLMAVSERQLQRKLKALIDQNPMDMLREFRLKKSCELLKDGYQVGLVSDQCGFNSPSYFSQCFKAQYGTTPKQYQQTTKQSR